MGIHTVATGPMKPRPDPPPPSVSLPLHYHLCSWQLMFFSGGRLTSKCLLEQCHQVMCHQAMWRTRGLMAA